MSLRSILTRIASREAARRSRVAWTRHCGIDKVGQHCQHHTNVAIFPHNNCVATTLNLNCNSAICCLVAASLVCERACSGRRSRHPSLVAAALLDKRERFGLRSPCGHRVVTLFVGCILLAGASGLLVEELVGGGQPPSHGHKQLA
jgi:hypothetical protein